MRDLDLAAPPSGGFGVPFQPMPGGGMPPGPAAPGFGGNRGPGAPGNPGPFQPMGGPGQPPAAPPGPGGPAGAGFPCRSGHGGQPPQKFEDNSGIVSTYEDMGKDDTFKTRKLPNPTKEKKGFFDGLFKKDK